MRAMTSGPVRKTLAGLLLAGIATAMLPVPALAQQDDARLRRIEAELRAMQRVVFPGGDGRFFTPEVDTSQPQQPNAGAPSNSTLTGMLARLDALEAQLARLTARSEESANELSQLQAGLAEARAAAAPPPVEVANIAPAPAPTPALAPARATPAPTPAPARVSAPTPSPTPAAATPSAARIAAVRAIAKPQTEDAGDDEYSYGFRLWEAGYFPEAQQQLALFLDKYPRHARTSQGRNLLGRAYLDNGQPRDAETHFFENYQNDKQGARAGDCLLFLAAAMTTLGDTNRACIALAEFSETYPALATGRLKEQYDRDRSKVTCRS